MHYLDPSNEMVIDSDSSRVNTGFELDHSDLPEMMANAINESKPWTLGDLPNGWEWFAFTFHDQDQFSLAEDELQEMLAASDRITRQAYVRMQSQWHSHPWAKDEQKEVEFIIKSCGAPNGASVLDFGCGNGRHVIEFARRGFDAFGIDYIHEAIDAARFALDPVIASRVRFHAGDCRKTEAGGIFDLGICLYDVIGSYADDRDNMEILSNLAKHIAPGGHVFLSVMNMELTERIAKNWFSISTQPDKLLTLQPSDTMEKSGNVFNPDFYMIDKERRVVYRKEQFRKGDELFEELLVRDRRYTKQEITAMCASAGLEVVWARFVRVGHWKEDFDRESGDAKEILVMCRKPRENDRQRKLFD